MKCGHLSGLMMLLVTAISASAADLVASYTFAGSLANDLPGFGIVAVENDQIFTPADFVSANVYGQPRTVLNLTGPQGLRFDVASLTDRSRYTLVFDVRSDYMSGYNKLASLDGGISDAGVYIVSNTVTMYNLGANGPALEAGAWTRVALTFDGESLNLYAGPLGELALMNTASPTPYYTLGDELLLFTDDAGTGFREHAPVQVAGLWLYDDALTPDELGALPAAVPEPTTIALFALGLGGLLGWARWRQTVGKAAERPRL